MIREMLESGYKRTVGALRSTIWDAATRGTRGSGLLQLVYILVLVGLSAGFISAVFSPVANQSYIVFPSTGAQSIPEMLVDAFVILVGGAGVYLVYLSGRQTVRTRTVNLYLGLAILLIAVSVLTGIELAILKGFG
ncbi:MAG TPA: hypothetical protein VKF15_07200 [Nitrososphaerales archaeon]|nr:hypothetical protein [Nitrososphaerales archaeon]